jgi:hypothetical protein
MKLGNTDFKKDLGKDISLSKFKKVYEGLLKGIDLETAYIKLGGKIKKASK